MNRLLGVHVDMQRKIFDYFTALQASVILMDAFTPRQLVIPRRADVCRFGTCQSLSLASSWLPIGLSVCHALS